MGVAESSYHPDGSGLLVEAGLGVSGATTRRRCVAVLRGSGGFHPARLADGGTVALPGEDRNNWQHHEAGAARGGKWQGSESSLRCAPPRPIGSAS